MKRADRLGMRVRPQDKKLWQETATKNGKSLSAWIEEQLNRAAAQGKVDEDD